MARGGYRPGAGRPKKSEEKTDTSVAKAPEVKSGQLTPLEYMLRVMNDRKVDAARRDRMAIAAAPFVHARPNDLGKKEGKTEAAKRVATGKFKAGAAPKLVVNNR